jgi:transcriptional regulator with XRE-family HTH domain
MRPSAFDPPAVPGGFWVRTDVTSTLRDRDIGYLLRLLRQYAGLSQTRIAAATGVAQGRLSNYATGRRTITTMAVWERIADGLDMPDSARACLGLAPRQPVAQLPASPADLAEQHTEFVRRITNARSIDSAIIRALDSETDAIRLQDRRLGAPAITDKLQAHIDHVATCLHYSMRPASATL